MRPILFAAIAILTAGCTMGAPTQVASLPSATPSLSPFLTAVPRAAVSPTAGPPPLPPTSAPTPFVPFTVRTWADNVLLRSNPGYLFPQITALKDNTPLTVQGQSPGGEWWLVQTADHRSGWVFKQLTETSQKPAPSAPIIQPASVQVVTGKVVDLAGVPISGVQFSIVQGAGNSAPRTDAMTDESGIFYAFMPADAHGTWTVGYTAIACTSNTMDASCTCIGHCGAPDPRTVDITLPLTVAEPLQFTWK
jgi:hypothetical protein